MWTIPFNYIGAAASLTLPIVASATRPRLSTRRLATVPQSSAPIDTISLTDNAGTPIVLTGRPLRLVVAAVSDEGQLNDITDDTIAASYKYESGDGLSVGGDEENELTIQHDSANTGTVGRYRYWLYDVTDADQPLPLLKGTFDVEPAATDV